MGALIRSWNSLGEEACLALERVFAYDPAIPLEPRIVEERERDRRVREKIVFRGARGSLVPGTLERQPTGEPQPCVLWLHGWSGSRQAWWEDGNYVNGSSVRNKLLDAGFAVLALDAQCHGERVAENDYALPNPHVPAEGESRRGYFTLQDIYVQTVVDYRRALDFLESRDEIDSERIGAIGYSMGGTQVFPLLAVEPRVRAAVACVAPEERDKWSVLAPQNYTRRVTDRPLLMLMGREDPMCSPEQATALFEFMEGPAIRLIFFEAGHKLPPDYAVPATGWLIEQLGQRTPIDQPAGRE